LDYPPQIDIRPTVKQQEHALVGLFRQSVFGRLAEYEDVNDAERLRHDPAMRWIVGGKATSGCAASPSQMGRFETKWLAFGKNLSALADLSGRWIDNVHGRRPPRGIVLDMDSSVSPTHGEQENSVWNGHYARTCYYPLFLFNQFGDLERCALRPGRRKTQHVLALGEELPRPDIRPKKRTALQACQKCQPVAVWAGRGGYLANAGLASSARRYPTDWDEVTLPIESGRMGFDARWYADFYHHLSGDTDEGSDYAKLLYAASQAIGRPLAMDYFAGALRASGSKRVVYNESHDEAGNSPAHCAIRSGIRRTEIKNLLLTGPSS
jgi:Transposase DDE domain group 1